MDRCWKSNKQTQELDLNVEERSRLSLLDGLLYLFLAKFSPFSGNQDKVENVIFD